MQDKKLDLGELSNDTDLKSRIENFESSIENVGKIVETMCSQDAYDKMTLEEKVQYDLFLSFSINSLYWIYLKTQGVEPKENGIKAELKRVREYMSKSTKLHERRTIMPHIDKDAAKRFIRGGLWDPKHRDDKVQSPENEVEVNLNKRKRDDLDS